MSHKDPLAPAPPPPSWSRPPVKAPHVEPVARPGLDPALQEQVTPATGQPVGEPTPHRATQADPNGTVKRRRPSGIIMLGIVALLVFAVALLTWIMPSGSGESVPASPEPANAEPAAPHPTSAPSPPPPPPLQTDEARDDGDPPSLAPTEISPPIVVDLHPNIGASITEEVVQMTHELGESVLTIHAAYLSDSNGWPRVTDADAFLILDLTWHTVEGSDHVSWVYFDARNADGSETRMNIMIDSLLQTVHLEAGEHTRGSLSFEVTGSGPYTVIVHGQGLTERAHLKIHL